MRASIAIATIFVSFALSHAAAQTGNPTGQSASGQSGQTTARPLGAGQKIPAHAQPRAADAPVETVQQTPADRELDRKLKGICRGC